MTTNGVTHKATTVFKGGGVTESLSGICRLLRVFVVFVFILYFFILDSACIVTTDFKAVGCNWPSCSVCHNFVIFSAVRKEFCRHSVGMQQWIQAVNDAQDFVSDRNFPERKCFKTAQPLLLAPNQIFRPNTAETGLSLSDTLESPPLLA